MKRFKTFGIDIISKQDDGGEIVINTDSVDRDRDRVFPYGARVGDYMRNPVVQFGHNYRDPWATVGKTTELETTATEIRAKFELRPAANENDPQNIVRLLWFGEWIRTASIGFMPDVDAMEENEFGGIDFNAWDLLEWSLVPIPANQDALRLAIKSLGFNRSVLDMSPVIVADDDTLKTTPFGEPSVVTNPKTKQQSKLYVVAFPVDADPDVILRVIDTADETDDKLDDPNPDDGNGRGAGVEPTKSNDFDDDTQNNNDPTSNNEPNNDPTIDDGDETGLVLALATLAETLKQI